jgi:hypothetical protein
LSMSSAPKVKPIWVRAMEAGFGDMLAEHGFRKIGPALYRLDREGVVWRSSFRRGYPFPPESFRDLTGGYIPALDDLALKTLGRRVSVRIGGGRASYHLRWDIADTVLEDRRTTEGAILDLGYYSLSDEFPFVEEPGGPQLEHAWSCWRHPPAEVVPVLARLWREHVWPPIAERKTVDQVVATDFDEDPNTTFMPHYILAHHLVGDSDFVQRSLSAAIRRAEWSEKDVTARLKAAGMLKRLALWVEGLKRRDVVAAQMAELEEHAETARRIASGLGVKI